MTGKVKAVITAPTRYGSTTFLKETGLSGGQMRGLEAAGVIRPTRSDSGWRQFTDHDIEAAKAWKAANVPPPTRKAQRRV